MQKIDRTGETRIMNCGMKATIIAYRGATDIDVQFEDGTIVRNKNYHNFVNGGTINPSIAKNRLGEIQMMKCGMQATIIVYRSTRDIDIQFEDGTILKNREYFKFKKGRIQNPNIERLSVNKADKRIDETHMMNCGMQATIIAYRSNQDIDIQFEDNTVVKNRTYNAFIKGGIAYPNKSINNIEIGSEAYRMGNKVYYNCACQKCHARMILTPQEMLQHHC